MDRLKTFLQSFSSISDEEFEATTSHFATIRLKKGEYLVEQGKICKRIAFVNSGTFRTYYINEKAEETTACFRTQFSIVSSYRSFVMQQPSDLAIEALEDSELIVISYDSLQELYANSMAWLNIGRLIAESEYISMEEYASVLNNESAKEKYLRLLQEQSEVVQKASVESIASYLGVTRRTLSRIRQEIASS